MTAPEPGSVWREKRTDLGDDMRRVVLVDDAETDGFVEGVGFYQSFVDGRWLDESWPGVRRKTRVRTHLFLQRYERVTS